MKKTGNIINNEGNANKNTSKEIIKNKEKNVNE